MWPAGRARIPPILSSKSAALTTPMSLSLSSSAARFGYFSTSKQHWKCCYSGHTAVWWRRAQVMKTPQKRSFFRKKRKRRGRESDNSSLEGKGWVGGCTGLARCGVPSSLPLSLSSQNGQFSPLLFVPPLGPGKERAREKIPRARVARERTSSVKNIAIKGILRNFEIYVLYTVSAREPKISLALVKNLI